MIILRIIIIVIIITIIDDERRFCVKEDGVAAVFMFELTLF